MAHHGFDKAEGIDIDRVPLASTEATRVGLRVTRWTSSSPIGCG
jgi:hypothetical protein